MESPLFTPQGRPYRTNGPPSRGWPGGFVDRLPSAEKCLRKRYTV